MPVRAEVRNLPGPGSTPRGVTQQADMAVYCATIPRASEEASELVVPVTDLHIEEAHVFPLHSSHHLVACVIVLCG